MERFWIDDNIPYAITFEGVDPNWVGLVDEKAGGIVAYGPSVLIHMLVSLLQGLLDPDEKGL